MSSNSDTGQFCLPMSNMSCPLQQAQTKGSAGLHATRNPGSAATKNQTSVISSLSPSGGPVKNHKVEGKNKKSLHQKQQQQQQQQRTNIHQHCVLTHDRQQKAQQSQQHVVPTNPLIRGKKNGPGSSVEAPSSSLKNSNKASMNVCSTLEDFSKIAQELKADINQALVKQAAHQNTDQPVEVVKLKNDILKLSGLGEEEIFEDEKNSTEAQADQEAPNKISAQEQPDNSTSDVDSQPLVAKECSTSDECIKPKRASRNDISDACSHNLTKNPNESSQENSDPTTRNFCDKKQSSCDPLKTDEEKINIITEGYRSDSVLTDALARLSLSNHQDETKDVKDDLKSQVSDNVPQTEVNRNTNPQNTISKTTDLTSEEFAALDARLDYESKLVTLTSSLQKHFTGAPHLLDPVCRKLVGMSDSNSQLMLACEKYRTENRKLLLVKQKLENLCRELQKSNNAIRIESFDLIKAEQGKAKEQTTKIQSTLSGVIKLFDENQQRNMSLRQENQDLQTKLKSLLDHCDNWEKSIEAALRQRDIENRLLKTELAKANLLKNEEQEKFLGEKQELLQILSMMQEQQHRIEGQEAKLRSDLSSYASKYDECQAVISKGMSKFQMESKRMLKQIEKSKQDYKVLLTKYETTNRRTTQLLEEKQEWHRSLNLANKKIETLEKLCRALQDRKQEVKMTKPTAEGVTSMDPPIDCKPLERASLTGSNQVS